MKTEKQKRVIVPCLICSVKIKEFANISLPYFDTIFVASNSETAQQPFGSIPTFLSRWRAAYSERSRYRPGESR